MYYISIILFFSLLHDKFDLVNKIIIIITISHTLLHHKPSIYELLPVALTGFSVTYVTTYAILRLLS
jgi:hypothetical protein